MKNNFLNLLIFAIATLAAFAAEAAAPVGSWWDVNYTHRRQISIPVIGAGNLALGYSLKVTFNHNAEVAAGRSLLSGNDVRVVYWNGTTWTDLDRLVDPLSSWNSTTTEIWFNTSAAITGATTNTDYYLYFGNAAAGAPLTNEDNIFLLYDDFNDASIDGGKWGTSGTVTEAGGVITVSGSASRLRADDGFGVDTMWETRASMSTSGVTGFNFWGTSSATTFTGDYLYFQSNAATYRANVDGTTQNVTVLTPTSMQNYSFARQGAATAHFWVNGAINATPTVTFATGAPNTSLRALMRIDAAGLSSSYDYVRIRLYRNVEPIPTLGALDDSLIAAWHMGEASWNGTVGEVNDSGVNGLDGRAFNGAQTAGGVPGCRYGTFNGTNQYVEVPDNSAFDRTTTLSVSVWIYPRSYGTELKSIVSKDENYEFHLTPAGQINWWWNGGGTRSITTTGTAIPLNQWTHIAITYQSGQQRVYINGVIRGTNNLAEALPVNALALQIGYDGAGSPQPLRYWDGFIDAVQIYGRSLSTAQVVAAMNATTPCPMNADHLLVTHDGFGIHCVAEPISVSPRDASNNPFTTYTELITLNTGSGIGDWALQTGTGTLTNGTANDGIATYQWVSGETTATFLLTYRSGAPSINITASSSTITDDNTEGNLIWSPNGFTVTSVAYTPPGAIPAFVSPQIAGTTFPIVITAYGVTPTDTVCGIIEGYTGGKNLKFWFSRINPAGGTLNVTINGTAIQTIEASSVAQAVPFLNGVATVNAKYKDVGLINVQMKDDTTINASLPNGILGATGNFVSKPHNILLAAITRTDGSVNAGPITDHTSSIFVAAGVPFRTTVTVRDFENSATPNFGLESPAESVGLVSTLMSPTGGGTSNPAVAQSGVHTYSGGVATNVNYSWPEVGVIRLTPHIQDGSYLGTGDVSGNTSPNVGRFNPFDFGVTTSTPILQTGCVTGNFTYMDQPSTYLVAPVINVTARAQGGSTTANYTGNYFKLTNASLTAAGKTYSAVTGTLTTSGVPSTDPVIADLTNGISTLTFSSGTGLYFSRPTSPTPPTAPFNAQITLSQNVRDTDLVVAAANPISFNNIAFSAGNEQRYGRISFRNAVGSEFLNLPLSMRAEYFHSAAVGFVTNTSDSCTVGVSIVLTNFGGNLAAGETCILDSGNPGASLAGCPVAAPIAQRFRMPPLAGDFVAILQAPGAGNSGTVTATTVVPTWLRFDWNAANPGLENPSGTAVFGVFQGESKRIFQTEK